MRAPTRRPGRIVIAVITAAALLAIGAPTVQAYNAPWKKSTHAKFTNQTAIAMCKADKQRAKNSVCKRPTDIRTERTCDKPEMKSIQAGRVLKLVYWVSHCDVRWVEVDPARPNAYEVVFGCRFRTSIGLVGGALGRCEGGKVAPFGFINWRQEGYI